MCPLALRRLFSSLDDIEGDSLTEKLRKQFIATHGKEPPKFRHKGFSSMEPMVEDIDVCRGWMGRMEADMQHSPAGLGLWLECDFTWVVWNENRTTSGVAGASRRSV